MLMRIGLSDDDKKFLSRRVEGTGGFQILMRDMQGARHEDEMLVSLSLAKRMTAYAYDYGDGGFQQRIRGLVAKLPPLPEDPQQAGLF